MDKTRPSESPNKSDGMYTGSSSFRITSHRLSSASAADRIYQLRIAVEYDWDLFDGISLESDPTMAIKHMSK